MRLIARVCAVVLCLSFTVYGQGNTFKKIRYQGGTVATKVKPDNWDNRLTVTSDEITLALKDGQIIKIDPKHVTGLSYGQEAHRRVGTMIALGILLAPLALFGLFHKTRLHYVGIEYNVDDEKKAGLLLQAHKDNYRAVLLALRGATGAPISVAESERKYIPAGIDVVVAKDEETPDESKKDAGKNTSPAEATGMIKLTASPDGAEVWVNGSFVGNAPSQLKLPVGKHKIKVVNEGYEEWEREIEVLAGSELTLNAALKKKG